MDPPWTRERDAATGCFYFFNPETGQSVWEEELEEEGSSAVGALASASAAAADDAGAHNEAEDDDEAEDALFLADRRGEARVQQVEAKTKHVMWTFCLCFMFHGCCCEGPAAAVEGVLRGLWYCGAGITGMARAMRMRSAAAGAAARHGTAEAFARLREGVLFLAAAVTLFVPCCALGIYRRFSTEGDWELGPIWTLAGRVDPRRFHVFNRGQTEWAANAGYTAADCMDDWPGQVLYPLAPPPHPDDPQRASPRRGGGNRNVQLEMVQIDLDGQRDSDDSGGDVERGEGGAHAE